MLNRKSGVQAASKNRCSLVVGCGSDSGIYRDAVLGNNSSGASPTRSLDIVSCLPEKGAKSKNIYTILLLIA